MRQHCWHQIPGVQLSVNPPIYPVRCCCGREGTMQSVEGEPIQGHGPYGPKEQRTLYQPIEPCPAELQPQPA